MEVYDLLYNIYGNILSDLCARLKVVTHISAALLFWSKQVIPHGKNCFNRLWPDGKNDRNNRPAKGARYHGHY